MGLFQRDLGPEGSDLMNRFIQGQSWIKARLWEPDFPEVVGLWKLEPAWRNWVPAGASLKGVNSLAPLFSVLSDSWLS